MDGVAPLTAAAEEQGQQFGVGQGLRAMCEQLFPQAFGDGPVADGHGPVWPASMAGAVRGCRAGREGDGG